MDSSRKKQKALPMLVLRKMMELSKSEWETATSWLLIGAIFFAMRSCEYLETNAREEARRTKILRVRNIQFVKGGKKISHHDKKLEESDMVMITFEFQKNDQRDTQIHMFKTNDPILNPVKAWARTIQRVLQYPGGREDSKVCCFWSKENGLTDIKADHVRIRLRAVVDIIGEATLGFTKDVIGLHSLRSGGAMAMFLSGTSTIVIRRIGRWSSEAFLEYIREQVEDFTAGVAQKMLTYENFSNLSGGAMTEGYAPGKVNKEDGPESVPFTIQFSQMALENEKEMVKRRLRR